MNDPSIPPAMGDDVHDLTDEEYDETYESGDGGHKIPPEVLEEMNGCDDPEAVPEKGFA